MLKFSHTFSHFLLSYITATENFKVFNWITISYFVKGYQLDAGLDFD